MADELAFIQSLRALAPDPAARGLADDAAVLRIGDDLVDPFANSVHDVSLNAMCRTIEIDLLQSIGDPAPSPVQPVKGVLW